MPVPQEAIDLIRKSAAFRDLAADALVEGTDPITAKILRSIQNKIAAMSSTEGGLRLSNANATKLNQLSKEIEQIIKSPSYVNRGKAYLRSFKELDNMTVAKFKALGVPAEKTTLEGLRNFTVNKLESDLLGEGLQSSVINPLMNKLNNLVASGGDFGHIMEEINSFMEGREGLNVHVNNIGIDTINQYNGASNERIGKEHGLNWGVYTGSIIKTSRGQCVRWVNTRYIHRSELQKEINFAFNQAGKKTNEQGKIRPKGTHRIGGMINPTTPSSFAINRGGHRCRHEFTYVSDVIVPEEVRARVE